MARTLSPLRYPGGKHSTYNYVRELIKINDKQTYIEPYAGGAGVAISLLLNDEVDKIIINDYDRSIYSFWYSVVNFPDKLIQKIIDCEISMDEWYKQKKIQEFKENIDELTLGFSTLFLNRTNRSGIIKAGVIGGKEQKGKYKLDCRFNKSKIISKIKKISSKKDRISIYNEDAYEFIDTVIKKNENSFTFFDPPYFEKGPSLYTNFYSQKDHAELATKIKNTLSDYVWIVTYDHNDKIKEMYTGLPYLEYFLTYTAQRKMRGIEYMFFSKSTKIIYPEEFLKIYSSVHLSS
ncbi:DNA adenine methylase [Bacillus ginsengihumi]|uniref:site-specific DNA-methyltransferase (adenine-specific) n=1 Tax=Heyndrickxia ginsengihumi TaxID=363870 RepID=A0A6M0P7K3_9BACI|nr:DNA adenine methylase [Heyndrickxia ginsengihumi]NEY20531.1 DNA adenine methylase [Heyndrickxia ginsengihumi]